MAEATWRPSPDAQAEQRVLEILRAADSWSKEAPSALFPAIRAVCIRLAEMVADQRHYLAPLPEPQESERRTVLSLVADRLRAPAVTQGLEQHLKSLEELELRSTGSWATVDAAQTEWITTAIRYLETSAAKLPAGERPDPYWADDVVAGIIASVRALIGVDELHARTEARYSGPIRKDTLPPEE
ncbi:MAG TPA: hypothetical protein VL287_13755 [Gemmatimonadales bacterium]|jgi:hypothetical protein|nr:hypothetical protein [Gemmatimonadales bacterium]